MKNDTVKRVLGILAMAAAAAVLIIVAILTRGDAAPEKDVSGNSLTMRDFTMCFVRNSIRRDRSS